MSFLSLLTITDLHRYLRQMRFKRYALQGGDEQQKPRARPIKEYPRMRQISLADAATTITLKEATTGRRSAHGFSPTPIPAEALGGILDISLREKEGFHRGYPSGGGLFPIESYILVRSVEHLDPGCYHYRPDLHMLEFLWETPETAAFASICTEPWVRHAGAIVVFTALWQRNADTYAEFGLELGLIEAGHAAQNVVLSAHAHNIATRTFCSFNESVVAEMLDLETGREQAVYAIALGVRMV